MQDLWRRLESYLRHQAPAVIPTLRPPATDADIHAAEAALGVALPSDLAESLKIHNGQLQETGRPPHAIPLVPEEFDEQGNSLATWAELAPLELIVSSTLRERKMIAVVREYIADFEFRGPVRRDGNWNWIDVADPGSGDRLGLDLEPASGGQTGQVLSIIHDPDGLFVIAASYRQWFAQLVNRYETGRYFFADVDGGLSPMDRLNPSVSSGES